MSFGDDSRLRCREKRHPERMRGALSGWEDRTLCDCAQSRRGEGPPDGHAVLRWALALPPS